MQKIHSYTFIDRSYIFIIYLTYNANKIVKFHKIKITLALHIKKVSLRKMENMHESI